MIRICVTNKQKLTRKKESENKIQSMKVACDRSLTWLGTTLRTCTSPLTSSPVLLCRRWSSSLQRRIAQNLLRSRGSFFSFALLILFFFYSLSHAWSVIAGLMWACRPPIEWKEQLDQHHISLSRTFPLLQLQITPFVQRLQSALAGARRSPLASLGG
jgi:hypothetical protein